MNNLAVITGFGGINAAGRSTGHHGFRRMIFDSLSASEQEATLLALGALMGTDDKQSILDGTLVRGWDNIDWDADAVPFHEAFTDDDGTPCWRLTHRRLPVQSAGQLPRGFDPAKLYRSRNHPRGLQMAIFGASEALGSLGVEWENLCQHVGPDEIAVYAGSSMGQQDNFGHGGMMQSALLGKRTTSKQCAMGMSQMPADFINAYVLGNVGKTGSMTAACATFLYNLQLAREDIRSGRRRIVIVGNAEAPLVPEIVEGYHAMTALASEQKLKDLDGKGPDEAADVRRACRPFGDNCGFTLAESSQFFVLTDERLALELGLNILGSVGDVQVNADGYKKSISNPGIGNYLTLAKVVSETRRQFGADVLQNSFVHAHGSSTPQNRVTESHIYTVLAEAFDIREWPITAVKAYVGHSLASASADQLAAALGTWATGYIPGIKTTERIADDVHQERLDFVLKDRQIDRNALDIAFINAKGFGGNNASAAIISPARTRQLIEQQHSANAIGQWEDRNASVQQAVAEYETAMLNGELEPRYRFGEAVLSPEDLDISDTEIRIKGWEKSVKL